jgi:hypothetical protein
MNLKKIAQLILLLVATTSFAQITISEISAKDGNHFICNKIGYPIVGTYQFEGGEPIVDLYENGTGFYQLHEQVKRPIIWGIECFDGGIPKFKKGFDSAEYTFWYKYTDAETDDVWNVVEFSIHFRTKKMFIQGERLKLYNDEE